MPSTKNPNAFSNLPVLTETVSELPTLTEVYAAEPIHSAAQMQLPLPATPAEERLMTELTARVDALLLDTKIDLQNKLPQLIRAALHEQTQK